jgi:hypothetical protein
MTVSADQTYATATQGSNPSNVICVYRKTTVEWNEGFAAGASYKIDFGGNTPFNQKSTFQGTSTSKPAKDTISEGAIGCYQYKITHRTPNGAKTSDPKVIVNGVRTFPHAEKK